MSSLAARTFAGRAAHAVRVGRVVHAPRDGRLPADHQQGRGMGAGRTPSQPSLRRWRSHEAAARTDDARADEWQAPGQALLAASAQGRLGRKLVVAQRGRVRTRPFPSLGVGRCLTRVRARFFLSCLCALARHTPTNELAEGLDTVSLVPDPKRSRLVDGCIVLFQDTHQVQMPSGRTAGHLQSD